MDLPTFISELGDAKAAKLFGVKPRTAASWRRGERTPRPEQSQKIIKVSGGKLSYESIYGLNESKRRNGKVEARV